MKPHKQHSCRTFYVESVGKKSKNKNLYNVFSILAVLYGDIRRCIHAQRKVRIFTVKLIPTGFIDTNHLRLSML